MPDFINNFHLNSSAIPYAKDAVDYGIPWHYGNPLGEQNYLKNSLGIVDLSNRRSIIISGKDRIEWLNSLVTKDLTKFAVGDTGTALILDAKGHLEYNFTFTLTPDTLIIDTEAFLAENLFNYLQKMIFWPEVEVVKNNSQLISIFGEGIKSTTFKKLLNITSEDTYGEAENFWWRKVPNNFLNIDLWVKIKNYQTMWNKLLSLQAKPAGNWAYEALRIENLQSRLNLDTDATTLPHETNWVRNLNNIKSAVDFNKGCYPGQETVAKIQNTGTPPRNTYLMLIDNPHNLPLKPGETINFNQKKVGRLGSVVQHHQLGWIGLGLIKNKIPTTAQLTIAEKTINLQIDPDSVPLNNSSQSGKIAVENWKKLKKQFEQ